MTLLMFIFVLWCLPNAVTSILPTAEVHVVHGSGAKYKLLASQASFGQNPPMVTTAKASQLAPLELIQPPSSVDPLMCENITESDAEVSAGTVMMIPRGSCTFEQKAYNAQRLGASGVIIYGNLEHRYSINQTTKEQIYPVEYHDYDCVKGEAEIPLSALSLPYDVERDNPLLSGPSSSNLCLQNSADGLGHCESKACLLTGNLTGGDAEKMTACCAWDLHIWLYADSAFNNSTESLDIPAVYLSMQDANQLLQNLSEGITVTIFSRWRSKYDISSILIWALGVFVAALASYMSADEYRAVSNAVLKRASRQGSSGSTQRASRSSTDGTVVPYSASASGKRYEDELELNSTHAWGFVIMASTGLFVLFFFKIYNVVKVMYAFGCSKALMQVIFDPIWHRILRKSNRIVWRTGTEDFGDITYVDIFAFICGYSWGAVWLYVAFTAIHPENSLFFWVTQDVMGACMCIMFLSIIKLNSIQVATILLLVAFVYDIFFVFITPLIFKGESVMITVATSGGPPKADPLWCEKYPRDMNCRGGDPLPMLLTIPRLEDIMGGASMLGLGDIVLPGLLLSFAARLDSAKEMVEVIGGGTRLHACPRNRWCSYFQCKTGYFCPLIVAYAVGLFMANAAVYIMSYGQPALLYLVPCCLGTMSVLAWRQKELGELWNGPQVIRTADSIIYGDPTPPSSERHQQLPSDEGLDAPEVPSAMEDSESQANSGDPLA